MHFSYFAIIILCVFVWVMQWEMHLPCENVLDRCNVDGIMRYKWRELRQVWNILLLFALHKFTNPLVF